MVVKMMPAITLKNLPADLHKRLKQAAKQHHRSLQGEIIACLERYVRRTARSKEELLRDAAQLRAKLPQVDHTEFDRLKREGRP